MGRVLDVPTAEVFEPLLKSSRYKGAYGGRGSAKSHFFADRLITRCKLARVRAVCVREVQKSLDQSVKQLLEDKIDEHQLGGEFRVTNTYIETPHQGSIHFHGMQDHTAESIKSLEGIDIAWVEEAQSLSERSLSLLRPTIRKEGSEIWCSWNPRYPTDPVDVMLRGPHKPHDAIVVKSNFRDNPWFPEVLRMEMEWDRGRDVDKYNHIWLGDYEKKSEARVFKNWTIDTFDTPDDVTLRYGADWGFSVDPSTMVRCWLRDEKTLMIDREVYRIGVEIDHLPDFFDTLDEKKAREWPSVADSARPETISYLQRHGYPRMEAAKKGANSVKEGVIFLQGYNIVVHSRCTHTIDEFTHYSYVVDKASGIVTPILEDKKNHIIDPVRYATEALREPAGSCVW